MAGARDLAPSVRKWPVPRDSASSRPAPPTQNLADLVVAELGVAVVAEFVLAVVAEFMLAVVAVVVHEAVVAVVGVCEAAVPSSPAVVVAELVVLGGWRPSSAAVRGGAAARSRWRWRKNRVAAVIRAPSSNRTNSAPASPARPRARCAPRGGSVTSSAGTLDAAHVYSGTELGFTRLGDAL
jgi:hypothetical protein